MDMRAKIRSASRLCHSQGSKLGKTGEVELMWVGLDFVKMYHPTWSDQEALDWLEKTGVRVSECMWEIRGGI